jgi:hypothetical protein
VFPLEISVSGRVSESRVRLSILPRRLRHLDNAEKWRTTLPREKRRRGQAMRTDQAGCKQFFARIFVLGAAALIATAVAPRSAAADQEKVLVGRPLRHGLQRRQ